MAAVGEAEAEAEAAVAAWGGDRSPAPELLRGAFRALRTLEGQLNLGDDVLKITIDWNKLQSLSALQPTLLFSALQQHVLYLQIDRRISAFIERKQAEINENNVREFCNVIDCNQENSCARTDAVFTPYPGFKSHVKVSRVVNTYGPQTRAEGAQGSGLKATNTLRDCGNQAVEERLQNIEAHLRLQTGGPVPRDIYQRIKKLEDKILELEGLSPEYFQSVSFSGKRRKIQPPQESYSLAELDEKINALKQALLRKSSEAESRETDPLP
ncbi:MAP3K12-binding inhibitory protein 1 isoform X2 [Ornithorhynchus anatinus]|uniref:MAP3K12-binding inhibitory protein 1 isoform X2 n=1 Tax=Ornithorhynchus anatinus TaxID=9258 RepID=UPI0019D46298|nr:MAP3K12-binding inhibitory protein 1 isoform X2 [Ornithorhynchus anatinus]